MSREHLWIHHEQDATKYWKLAEGGYPGRMSVRQGERLTLHISSSRALYDIFVYREGARRELIHTIHDVRGDRHEVPEYGYRDGFAWPATVDLAIGDDWRSGMYIAQFASAQGPREILFVVRPKAPRGTALVTIAGNTYAAYNNVGGKSFYDYISTDRALSPLLSVERPLQPGAMGNFHYWDQFFTSWLDAEGYDFDYCINTDHDAEPDLLGAYRANIRIGHDEYNSLDEMQCLETFIKGGGSLLSFSGNALFWKVEIRDEGRRIFCDKPPHHNEPTPDHPVSIWWHNIDHWRQRLLGVAYSSFVHAKKGVAGSGEFHAPLTDSRFGFYRVTESDHWSFAGTGLAEGDEFGRADGIVGVEADAADLEFVDGRPRYTGRDGVSSHWRILAIGDASTGGSYYPHDIPFRAREPDGDASAYGVIVANETEHKGTIYNASTIQWAHGLHSDPAVAAITRNVLDRLAV
ncbi:MAG: hypothetical protein CMJ18_27015 [Phycisphaeraceae bacterium]|nr:hypothetical protein [Phycisphaeraceae bacterium]